MSTKKLFRICAGIMGISGIIILGTTLFPILQYEWESAEKYPILLSPLVEEESGQFKFGSADYTKASNWIPGKEAEFTSEAITYFTVSIPKLRIQSASVAIGGEDLEDSLIQYPGTGLPGRVGNAVIFGHSILPQFFDPKNYLAIFSTLHTLQEGDLVQIAYDGANYTYQVETKFEVRPTDLEILRQSQNDSYVTLVTCTPPGHPLKPKRLIVRAKLVPNSVSKNAETQTFSLSLNSKNQVPIFKQFSINKFQRLNI